MANELGHYRELAARAYAEAEQATLENARDRALRSAHTFEAMAVQHERTLKSKLEREAQIKTRKSGRSSCAFSPHRAIMWTDEAWDEFLVY